MAAVILILVILYRISELSKVTFYASFQVATKSTKMLSLKLTINYLMVNSLKYTLIQAFFALRLLPLCVTKLVHLW
jgi:hypothetical protein